MNLIAAETKSLCLLVISGNVTIWLGSLLISTRLDLISFRSFLSLRRINWSTYSCTLRLSYLDDKEVPWSPSEGRDQRNNHSFGEAIELSDPDLEWRKQAQIQVPVPHLVFLSGIWITRHREAPSDRWTGLGIDRIPNEIKSDSHHACTSRLLVIL
jgi:hypothetical protein